MPLIEAINATPGGYDGIWCKIYYIFFKFLSDRYGCCFQLHFQTWYISNKECLAVSMVLSIYMPYPTYNRFSCFGKHRVYIRGRGQRTYDILHIGHFSRQWILCYLITRKRRGVLCHNLFDVNWLAHGFGVHCSIEIPKSALSNYSR